MNKNSSLAAETNWNLSWELIALLSASGSALLGLTALLGWFLNVPVQTTFGTDLVPMAPSTALLFLLFGLSVFSSGKVIKGTTGWKVIRALTFGGLLVALALLFAGLMGIQPGLEHPGFDISETAAGFPAGHMSPLTALCFILAGITLLLMLYSDGKPGLLNKSSFLASLLLLLVSIVLITFYLLGAPLLYRSGTIPPALTTSLAFLFLAVGLFVPAARKIGLHPEHRSHQFSGKSGVLILMSVFSAVIIVAMAYLYFQNFEERFRAEAGKDMSAIADLKVHQLVNWREERLADAMVFYQNENFSKLVNQYLENPADISLRNELDIWLSRLRDAYQYDRVAILDSSGSEMFSVPRDTEPEDPHRDQSLEEALNSGAIQFLDLHLHSGAEKPYMGVVVPIPVPGRQDIWNGALLLRIDPEHYLYPMLMNWPTPSETAETLIVRKEGEQVLFLNPLLFNESAAMRLLVPLSRSDLPAAQAVTGREGIVEGKDYRGIPVLAAVRAIPDSPWFLVARIDLEEVYRPLRERMWWTVMLVGILLLLAGSISGVIWQRNIKTHYRKLHQAESLYGTTLRSIGDGVIVANSSGIVELLNPVAEELTGWKAEQAAQKPLEEVFRIINEDSREKVQNPAAKVIKEGVVVGLANHTLLLSRDGREIPISDSGAPIKDKTGDINGVVLVFSDQTDERNAARQLKASESKYRGLFNSIRDAILVADVNRNIVDCNSAFTELFGYKLSDIAGKKTRIIYENEDEFKRLGESIRDNPENPEFIHIINYRTMNGRVFPGETNVSRLCNPEGEQTGLIGVIRDISGELKQKKQQTLLREQLFQAQKMESVGRLAGGVAHDFNNMLSVIIGNTELVMHGIEDSDPLRPDLERIHQSALRSAELTRQLLAFARKQTISPRVLDFNKTLGGMLDMLHRLIGENIEIQWNPGEDLWPLKMDPAQLDQILVNLCLNARDAISGAGKLTIETRNAELDSHYCEHHQGFIPGEFVSLSVSDNGAGMAPEVMEHLFEPFFTTKRTGEGTGLGLATVYGIVKQNDGFINVYSEPGQGSTFRIYFPRYCGPDSGIMTSGPMETSLGGGETVLIVEDEKTLLKLGRMMLEKLGYKVLAAGTPGEALQLISESDNEIDLLITDVVMPEMNGLELSRLIKERCPGIRTLFMSGYTANVIAHHGVLDKGVHFLEKPFSMKTLDASVRKALHNEA